jgi:hypothetical protein
MHGGIQEHSRMPRNNVPNIVSFDDDVVLCEASLVSTLLLYTSTLALYPISIPTPLIRPTLLHFLPLVDISLQFTVYIDNIHCHYASLF